MRYGRHLIMPEVGVEGQEKLKAAKILMIGAGGLGSPSGLYLAASGIGEITILDPDTVDVSNLQRQILHDSSSVGVPKVESANKRMNEVNPFVKINAIQDAVSTENVEELVAAHDIIVDGTDNFETRYIVNDACVLHKKLNVYGSIFRFDGQATVFCDPNGPCYRCMYPTPPPPAWCPPALKAECWEFCPESSAPFRRPRPSSSSWEKAIRSSGVYSPTMLWR